MAASRRAGRRAAAEQGAKRLSLSRRGAVCSGASVTSKAVRSLCCVERRLGVRLGGLPPSTLLGPEGRVGGPKGTAGGTNEAGLLARREGASRLSLGLQPITVRGRSIFGGKNADGETNFKQSPFRAV